MPFLDFENKHSVLVEALKRASHKKRLSHAYILQCADPGKTRAFSIAFAQLTVCDKHTEKMDACGKCDSCRHIEAGTYPDFFLLSPKSKSRQIRIGEDRDDEDTIREFQSNFYLSSFRPGGKKIGVIYDADCMTTQAQNAFLKTLEEPPGNSIIVLCTHKPSMLLQTIRSRCQVLMLMESEYKYQFQGKSLLLELLHQLFFSEEMDIYKAMNIADKLLDIMKTFKNEAEDNIEKKYEKVIGYEYFDSKTKERLKDKISAEQSAEYIRIRDSFLSVIHAFASQAYMLSCGVPVDSLANPDFFKRELGQILDDNIFYKRLLRTEALLQNLEWNVSEEPNFKSFCLDILG